MNTNPSAPELASHWLPEIESASRRILEAGGPGDAVAAVTALMEDFIRASCDAPRAMGGVELARFAFHPKDGRLTRHLDGGQADGIQKLAEGMFQFVRNGAHHTSRLALNPSEAAQAISAVNYLVTVTRRLAHETYLQPFTSRFDLVRLLRVRHLDLDGDGHLERIVTFSTQTANSINGAVLVLAEDGGVWRAVPSRLTAEHGYLGGDIELGYERDSGSPTILATFSRDAIREDGSTFYFHEAVVFRVASGELSQINLPEAAKFSSPNTPEIVDHLGMGGCQLLSYHPSGTSLMRFAWDLTASPVLRLGAPEPVIDARTFLTQSEPSDSVGVPGAASEWGHSGDRAEQGEP